MINLYFGTILEKELSPDSWMKHCAPRDVLCSDFSKNAIKVIDKTEVLGNNCLYSNPLGYFSMNDLSTGVKAVLYLKYGEGTLPEGKEDYRLNLRAFGENCYPFLCDLANEKDLTVNSSIFIDFYRYGYKGDVHILNDDTIVSKSMDLFLKYHKCMNG